MSIKTYLNIATLVALITLGSCTPDELTPREQQINILTSASWKTEQVIHAADGDLTFQYEAFSISFLKDEGDGYQGEYYVTHGGSAFTDSFGKWKCNSDLTSITLENGMEVESTLTKDNLTLQLSVPPPSGGRTQGVSGEFTFLLKH